ncbi:MULTISPECIES: nuclear transport factor 2 family protein [Sphingomonadales]|uniref:Steroid Delta-isomerase n=1 Tax=Edaphosphingomonas haloaromaticamans TaxID=653954 RepID=A0A1S1HE16_9SPHN|nr:MULTISPECIES: nuclear transport factor 2 family protein [Sphingomonas]AGH48036.1 nuclear transport factor 2 [Sphingomonas sp. MM-1]MDX3884967.1 nuclear transport factor 2 family protein [Sphingomonas sp.]OHT20435.1 Steroid Delta-isomerase [Sphingomonas haloaromaticamans]
MKATPEQVRAGLENYIRAWQTRDKDLLLSVFAEDGVLEDPVGTPPFAGHENIGRFWDFAWSDSRRQVTPVLEEIRACGDQGILRFTMQVRLPSENAGLDLSIIEHAQFNADGKLCHLRAFWDENSVKKPDGMDLFAPNIDEAYQS